MTNLAEFTSVLVCQAAPKTDLQSVKDDLVRATFLDSNKSIQIQLVRISCADISKS